MSLYRTTDRKTYEHFKAQGLEIELVEPTLLDICLKLAKQVAPRGNKYYLLDPKQSMEETALAISKFDPELEFEIANYNKCYMDGFVLYLL